MEIAAETSQNHHNRDEIDNYIGTEKLLEGWVASPWPSSYMIPTIHQSLLNGVKEYKSKGLIQSEPGVPRKVDLRIVGEPRNFYVNGDQVEPTLRDYFSDLDNILKKLPDNLDGNLEDIIHKSAWAYYVFERIHPYFDGNGRTGRMILNRVLMGSGIEKIIFLDDWFSQERNTHLDAMNLSDRLGSLEPLELYLAYALSSKKSLSGQSEEIAKIIDKKENAILNHSQPQPISRIWSKFAGIDIAGADSFTQVEQPGVAA